LGNASGDGAKVLGKKTSKDETYSNDINKLSCYTSVSWCYCSVNNNNHKIPMTAEEKLIIEQLLVGCSPTVQRIVNVGNKFTIPPPFDDEESDECSSDEENIDKLMDEIKSTMGIVTTHNGSNLQLKALTQQLSPTISDIE